MSKLFKQTLPGVFAKMDAISIFTVSMKIHWGLSSGITTKSDETATYQVVYWFFSCSSRDTVCPVLYLQCIRSMVWVGIKNPTTLFLAHCLIIPLLGSRWSVSQLCSCLWWSLLILGGKLRCKGTQKSSLLPTMSTQEEPQACPEQLPGETVES